MWDFIWHILIFLTGIGIGKLQFTETQNLVDINNMQKTISDLTIEQEYTKKLLIDAEQKAETWERRYNSLIPEEKEI